MEPVARANGVRGVYKGSPQKLAVRVVSENRISGFPREFSNEENSFSAKS
uniref:Uncharacterized protein n=1 Tax=Arundo donax TaxID=35708 RepID=A0A0A9CBI0_ARUDO